MFHGRVPAAHYCTFIAQRVPTALAAETLIHGAAGRQAPSRHLGRAVTFPRATFPKIPEAADIFSETRGVQISQKRCPSP